MIATLRESKAKLSELVELAAGGEEVLITVRGRPKAKLVALQKPNASKNLSGWANELETLQKKVSLTPLKGGAVLEDLRGDRW